MGVRDWFTVHIIQNYIGKELISILINTILQSVDLLKVLEQYYDYPYILNGDVM